MKIKNIAEFRTWIKNEQDLENREENFVGSEKEVNGKKHFGFFSMYHGIKANVYDFLRKEVEMAEDGQAIYEFLQNAADSNSTHFYMFYNENYFLAINNGEPFTKEGVKSILNVGQSYGKTDDPDKIGRFGIGFKLVHRLVGETSGLDELIKDYSGPQMFSWRNSEQLNSFLQKDSLELNDFTSKAPWLLKILVTNFPTMPGEEVLDLNYQKRIPYPIEEVREFQHFLQACSSSIEMSSLIRGTMFFLKLGKGKVDLLKKDKEELENGIENSLFFLKTINTVRINNTEVRRNSNLTMEAPFSIAPGTEEFNSLKLSEERDLKFPAKLQFGYLPYKEGLQKIKTKPNFYKYFPIGDETNGLNFILHSNVFGIESNRRKIHEGVINKGLLKLFATKIKELLEDYKYNNKLRFLEIYANFLVSDRPANSGNSWQAEYFYDIVNEYLQDYTPTAEGSFIHCSKVRIKNTDLPVNPIDWGIDFKWFYWKDVAENEYLLKDAKNPNKLALKKRGLSALLENGEIQKINNWLKEAAQEDYVVFLQELNDDIPEENFHKIKFLKFSNGKLYSIEEIGNYSNVLLLFSKIKSLKKILNKLGFVTSLLVISDYENIQKEAAKRIGYLKNINEKELFDNYLKKATIDNELLPEEKRSLFLGVKELHGVGRKMLLDWKLFSNRNGNVVPLNQLVNSALNVEAWLKGFQINPSENNLPELQEYLLSQNDVFPSIIYPFWDQIIRVSGVNRTNIAAFYSSINSYYIPDEHKQYSLTDKTSVFTENGFKNQGYVFYHQSFTKSNDYESLKSAIEKFTGCNTPSGKILVFLQQEPFYFSNDSIIEYLKEVTLSGNEAYHLLEFCKAASLFIFKEGVFIQGKNEITYKYGKNLIQYFSEDENLISFIENHLNGRFTLLPKGLTEFKSMEGVLRNEELYKTIINELDDDGCELGSELLPLLKHKEVLKNYIRGISEIRIVEKASYSPESHEYILLSNIFAHFEDQEVYQLREKIIIESSELEFGLGEVISSDEVTIELEETLYPLKVSKILPESTSFQKASIIRNIIIKINKAGLQKNKIDILLGNQKEEEDEFLHQIAEELQESLNENTLENAEQLAFCILYEKCFGWDDFQNFQVLAKSGDSYTINSHWYLEDHTFLNETAILDVSYKGLKKKLKGQDELFVEVGNKGIFMDRPFFDDEKNFICHHIEEELDEGKVIDLFEYLYMQFKSRGRDSERDFEETDWSCIGDIETEKVIGFNPILTIIANEEFLLEEEITPDWLLDWYGKDNLKKKFLGALGIHFEDSSIILLRKSLLQEELLIEPGEIIAHEDLNEQILNNTLQWLVEAEVWQDKVVLDMDKIRLLETAIEKIEEDPEKYWHQNVERLLEESEEWEDAFYQQWREEEDSFEIRLFQGELLMHLEYEEAIIAEKRAGDFWYDEDEEILYLNCQKNLQLLLQQAAEAGAIEEEYIRPFIQNGLARVSELEEENRLLKMKVQELSQPEPGRERGGLDKTNQMASNQEAKDMLRQKLEALPEFDCTGWKDNNTPKTIIKGVMHKGIPVTFVVRSCIQGDLHLHPNEWNILSSPNTYLALRLSQKEVAFFDKPKEAIMGANKTLRVDFNVKQLSIGGIDSLSQALSKLYLVGTGYVFNAPGASRSITIQELGQENTHEGLVTAGGDDEY